MSTRRITKRTSKPNRRMNRKGRTSKRKTLRSKKSRRVSRRRYKKRRQRTVKGGASLFKLISDGSAWDGIVVKERGRLERGTRKINMLLKGKMNVLLAEFNNTSAKYADKEKIKKSIFNYVDCKRCKNKTNIELHRSNISVYYKLMSEYYKLMSEYYKLMSEDYETRFNTHEYSTSDGIVVKEQGILEPGEDEINSLLTKYNDLNIKDKEKIKNSIFKYVDCNRCKNKTNITLSDSNKPVYYKLMSEHYKQMSKDYETRFNTHEYSTS